MELKIPPGFKHIHPQANNPQAGVASYLPFKPSSPPPKSRRAILAKAPVDAVLMAKAGVGTLARPSEVLETAWSSKPMLKGEMRYRKAPVSPLFPPRSSTCPPMFRRPEDGGDYAGGGEGRSWESGRDWAEGEGGLERSWSGPLQTANASSPRYTGTHKHARAHTCSCAHAHT